MSGKTILMFCSGRMDNIGGVQRSYQFLTQHLLSRGYIVYCVIWKVKGEIKYKFPDGVNVLEVQQDSESLQICISKIMKETTPDIAVIINSSRMALTIMTLLYKYNIPILFSVRGSLKYCISYIWPCRKAFDSATYYATKIHILMPSYIYDIAEPYREKVTVIQSPIEKNKLLANTESPQANGRFSLLYSGRLSFEKRVDIAIKAFALLASEFPDWDFYIYGTGPEENKCKQIIQKFHLERRVIFKLAQNTDEMYTVYSKANLKVLPSQAEGCPMALREAMIHEVPVIAFKGCSGCNEIIVDGKNGLLVDEGEDIVASLACALKKMMESPQLRKQLAQEGRKTALMYAPENINQQWENLIEDTISSFSNSTPQIKEKEETKEDREIFCNALNTKTHNIFWFKNTIDEYKEYKEDYLLLYEKQLFNHIFYVKMYNEVILDYEDPLLHYLREGWKKGYSPSANFNGPAYMQKYMQGQTDNPLVYYYRIGRFRGDRPIPFDGDKQVPYSFVREILEETHKLENEEALCSPIC